MTVALTAPAAPAAAGPPPVQCGAVLTTDTALRADLTCPSDALTVAADGITVDLRGHTIRGSGTGTGITIIGHHSVRVRNGTVTAFATDVLIDTAQDITLTRLTLTQAGSDGLRLRDIERARFETGRLRSARLVTDGSIDIVVDRSRIDNSPLIFVDSFNPAVTHSVLTDSFVNFSEISDGVVAASTLTRSPVFIVLCARTAVRHNLIAAADPGVLLGATATGTQVIGNTFTGNTIGVLLEPPLVDLVDGTTVSHNVFRDNAAAGVLFDTPGVQSGGSVVIDHNQFVHNGFAAAGRTDHLGNPVADGLHVAVPAGGTIRVAHNVTRRNARYGIFAVPGTVIDGGGNVSVADPLGCLGVVCR
ncbi:right-handed parallel beta-helix repeat-containing protein [Dactylosporangium sp. NPDC050688]|uniref:right-handed parallel beta-helix repeat-containing protein n=1 Tax=Dactylosporangium sp. NPDC050688 TaxID=3157217 RepID=UPI0033EBA0F6